MSWWRRALGSSSLFCIFRVNKIQRSVLNVGRNVQNVWMEVLYTRWKWKVQEILLTLCLSHFQDCLWYFSLKFSCLTFYCDRCNFHSYVCSHASWRQGCCRIYLACCTTGQVALFPLLHKQQQVVCTRAVLEYIRVHPRLPDGILSPLRAKGVFCLCYPPPRTLRAMRKRIRMKLSMCCEESLHPMPITRRLLLVS